MNTDKSVECPDCGLSYKPQIHIVCPRCKENPNSSIIIKDRNAEFMDNLYEELEQEEKNRPNRSKNT
jgi:NMD protein affecting ribosome stability and mRNA decay